MVADVLCYILEVCYICANVLNAAHRIFVTLQATNIHVVSAS